MNKRSRINLIHLLVLLLIEGVIFLISRPANTEIYFMIWCVICFSLLLFNVFGGLGSSLNALGFYDSAIYTRLLLSEEESTNRRVDPLNSNSNLVYLLLGVINIVAYIII